MKKSLIAVVALLVLCTSMAYSQDLSRNSFTSFNTYDFDFIGGGARAKGMGNAFLGVSNDVTGGSWNPSGLYEIDETIISISRFTFAPKGVSTTQSFTDFTSTDHNGSFSNISAVNFVSPLRVKGHPFVFSLNLTRNFLDFAQFGYKNNETRIDTLEITEVLSFIDTNLVNKTQSIRKEGGLNSLNIGFGTRFRDNISFGISINIYSGKSVLAIDEHLLVENARYNLVQFATANQYNILIDTNKFSGANFTIGAMYNTDKLDIGMTIRTPFKLREDREQSLDIEALIGTELGETPIYVDQILKGDILFKYEMPLMIGLGVGYKFKENILLAADLEFRGFSGNKIDHRLNRTINPGGNNKETFEQFDPQWKDVFSVRLGAEYMKAYDFADVPFRTGFSYVPVPTPSVSFTGETSSVVNYNFTAGSGIYFEQIRLDFAYIYTTSNLEVGVLNGTSDFKNHNLTISFSGVF